MKKTVGILVLTAFCLGLPTPVICSEVVDKVVAVVNDEAITKSELDQLLIPIYEQYTHVYKGAELLSKLTEARQNLLNQLIEDKLVYQEAKRLGVDVREEEIEERMLDFTSRFKDENEFEQVLKAQGLTINKLRERLRRQISIRKLHHYEIKSRVIVSPKDIQDYYNEHLSEYVTEERIKIKSITIKKSDEAVKNGAEDKEAFDRAEVLRAELEAGADFKELAMTYSEDSYATDGGDMGFVESGDMIKNVEDELFALDVGETSKVLETSNAYHIFRVEEKIPEKVEGLDEVRDEIYGVIFREKSRERFEEWMKELKRNAYISIR